MDSFSMHRNQVHWTRFLCRENRVLWTRFLRTFFVRESLSSCRNRVLFTRIAKNQNSLKRFLTNDIVWVLLLFSKKNPQLVPPSVSNRDVQVQIPHPQFLNYKTKLFTNQKKKIIQKFWCIFLQEEVLWIVKFQWILCYYIKSYQRTLISYCPYPHLCSEGDSKALPTQHVGNFVQAP